MTTGMPRTYSTASVFICSRRFMYWRMNSRPRVFMVYAMMPIAVKTGTRQASPNRQSKAAISATASSGTSAVPAMSGSWWARKEWVMLALSSIILRIRPVVLLSKKPSGMPTMRRMALLRMLLSTRNAAKCEHISAPKYSTTPPTAVPAAHHA